MYYVSVSVSVAKYDKCQTSSELMDCVSGERVELRESDIECVSVGVGVCVE